MNETEAVAGHVTLDVVAGVATLTLRNPRKKNAITAEMAAQIQGFADRIDADEAIGAVLVRAAGNYFCSGADVSMLAAISAAPASEEGVHQASAVYETFARIGALLPPTIAVMEGGAVGAGVNYALAADVTIALPEVVIDSGFLRRNIHPGGGHLSLLGRGLGYSGAIAMAVLGERLTGQEAADRGLIWSTVQAEALEATLQRMTRSAADDPKLARTIKRSARLELGPPAMPWSAAIELERGVQMWSLGRKGSSAWSPRGVGDAPGLPA